MRTGPDAALTAQQRWVLVAGGLAVGLAFLDETAVVTALREMQADFGATSTETQWVMGAYLLALASFIAVAGRLADLHGRRRLFLVGVGLFGAGSLAAAAAPSEAALIAARAVQGAGAALLVPLGMANATAVLPEERRGWAVGIVSTGATVFLALGPLIGGGLTELVGWRWIFLVNLPAVAAIAAITLRWMPETRGAEREPIDVPGLVLLVAGLVTLVLALLNMADWGPTAPITLALLTAGVGLLAAFVVVERRVPSPLVDLDLLRIPAVTGSLCALFAIQFSILGLTVYVTLYLQHVLGYSPAAAGAIMLPTVLIAPFLAGPSGRYTDRAGGRLITSGSMLLAALALGAIALVAEERAIALLLPAFLAFGIARPLATVGGSATVLGAIPREARGVSSALVSEARQLGAVFGVAVLGLALTGLELHRRDTLLDGIDARLDDRSREALDGVLVGSDEGQRLAAGLEPAARDAVQEAAATAFVSGFRGAMLVAAIVAGLAAAISWRLLRDDRS